MSIILTGDLKSYKRPKSEKGIRQHRERLTKLRNLLRILRVIKPKVFDLTVSLANSGDHPDERIEARIKKGVRLGTCGAVGCAYGWAGLDPWFRKQGLQSNLDGTVFERNDREVTSHNWFRIQHEEAGDLFYGRGNLKDQITLRATRKKVELLIEKYSTR